MKNQNTPPKKHKLAHGEYALTDKSAWIEVKNFVVRICATDEGVEVDIYRNGVGDEMSLPVASTYASD